jgi:hypothetical protein
MLYGAPFGFPNTLPDHRGGRSKLNDGYGLANRKMAGVADGTTVIRIAMFVGRGDGLHANNAGKQQRRNEHPA